MTENAGQALADPDDMPVAAVPPTKVQEKKPSFAAADITQFLMQNLFVTFVALTCAVVGITILLRRGKKSKDIEF